jgi:hypothetical protein
LADLSAWRKFWDSPEKGSLETDSIRDDPRQWELLKPDETKAYGADVSRIVIVTPAKLRALREYEGKRT